MFDISMFPIADAVRRAAQLSQEDYQRLYRQSIEQPDTFWAEQARRFLDWITPWHTVQYLGHPDRRRPMVCRRPIERQLQLHRPPPGATRRATGLHLGGR